MTESQFTTSQHEERQIVVDTAFLDPEGKRLHAYVVSMLLAQSSLPSGGKVFSDHLKLAVLPNRSILQLRLGARSVKTIASLRVAGRSLPAAMNS